MDHGDTFSLKGLSFRFELIDDTDSGAPWDNEDGHGPVREVRAMHGRPEKRPGEKVLGSDRGEWIKAADLQGQAADLETAQRFGRDPYNAGLRPARPVDPVSPNTTAEQRAHAARMLEGREPLTLEP